MQRYLSRAVALALPIALLVGCNSTQAARNAQQAPPSSPSSSASASDTSRSAGTAMQSWPEEGTRYLTSIGVPNIGATRLPDWVVNPTLDGVLGAIGVASENSLGTSHQIENARTSGRLEIARMLEVRVQDVGRRDIQQRLRVEGAQDLLDQGSSKSLVGVDRSIADSVLSGSRQRALWFDPATRDCYVWIVMDGAIQTKADHYVENGVSVFIANSPITKEFRPEKPKQPEPIVVAPQPKEPVQVQGPIEQLESRLKPIETIPTKSTGEGNQ